MRPLHALAPLLALVLAGGCDRTPPPNVLLLTVDTLRHDALGAWAPDAGYPTAPMPAIDALAAEGAALTRCYTVSPRTTQSFASFMTGLYPTHHGAFGLFHKLSDDQTTLAEILSKEGYRTVAVVTNFFLQGGRGFEQGFDVYDDSLIHSDRELAQYVSERVAAHLGELEEPYLLWVHWLDPHWPYVPPETELAAMQPPPLDTPFTLAEDLADEKLTRGQLIFENPLDVTERANMAARYYAEALHTDRHVARVVELLTERGLMENTLTVFYSDHGEALGEHGAFYAHGQDLYEDGVRVPAFVIFPGHVVPGAQSGLVSSADFLPTILDFVGVAAPPALDGLSLEPSLTGGAAWPRDVAPIESDYQLIYPENPRFHVPGPAGKWRAVVSGTHKLIRIPGSPDREWELYDVVRDPGETTNLIDSASDVRERLSGPLAEWEALVDRQAQQQTNVDRDATKSLRSLGYIN